VKTRKLFLMFTLAVALTGGALITVRFWPRPPLAARIPSSVAVLDDKGRLLRLTVAADEQYRLWTALDQVSPEFISALMLHEDRFFYWHPGVNPSALLRAAGATYTGGTRQGGSTLTMQLARLLYGLNTRTATGKLRQIALAIGLEMRYSKRELLEAHINLIPYGSNVQGVGAASLIYFGKPPSRLALNEALTLVLVPQAPASRNPRGETEPANLTTARLRLFAQWLTIHPDGKDQAEAMRIPLHYKGARNLPFEAPHFTTALLAQTTDSAIIQTTLELRQQQRVERVLQGYVREQSRIGIHNAAALLVDTRDMGTRAAVGSAEFADDSIAGQVNGTLAKRSPGSALKPFVYALAIDQGLIHPLTVLKDAPTAFGTFSPENFDGRFAGPISATEALIRSRNVPAVALSSRLSQPGFYAFLRSAGISQLASERHYGLALALGGGEVTMEEAATLYATLANHGLLRPLRHKMSEPTTIGTRLLSEEASFMTVDMLGQNPRPEDAGGMPPAGRLPVAWKTGTSWGFRDAWTAGIFGHYVLVVWVGNFDGSSNPAFVGAQAAAPLFFRIVDALHAAEPGIGEIWVRPPAGVSRVEVCAASGDLPNADCPQTATTWYIPGKSPIRLSDIHRRIWFDTRTGQQACPPYDSQFVRSEVFEFWSSDMLRLFAQAGMPRRQPPAAADCSRGTPGGQPPSINSPLRNATYTLRASRVGSESIPLAATTDGGVRTLHWFVDDAYVGTTRPDTAVSWTPGRSGAFVVRAIDDQGRADSRELRVAVVP
jgi:penicillin-binding protein 1C